MNNMKNNFHQINREMEHISWVDVLVPKVGLSGFVFITCFLLLHQVLSDKRGNLSSFYSQFLN